MKIGIISDIHGHLAELEAALRLLDSNGVDHIICAGDIADGIDDGDAVVALLREREIPCVQGNHDRDTFRDQAELRRIMRRKGMTDHPRLLSAQTAAYLSALPLTQQFAWAGRTICLAHGTPHSNMDYLFADSREERFREVITQTDADVIVLGHTHQPMIATVGETWILNAGAVSTNRFDDPPTRTCGVLHLPQVQFEVFNIDDGEAYAPLPHRQFADDADL